VRLEKSWGYVDKIGAVAIDIKYDEAFDFKGGIAIVRHNGLFGLINKTGAQILPFEFEIIEPCINEAIKAKKDGLYGAVDANGQIIKEFSYKSDKFQINSP
jgi:hypothetical protein